MVKSDMNCKYSQHLKYDVSGLEPMIAKPHTVDNVVPVSEVKGQRINEIVIGTCTNGRIDDLQTAAEILKGKKIDSGVRVLIFPASQNILLEALKTGIIEDLLQTGAVLMNPGCGPCLGAHEGALAPGEVALSTANRNFKGRMGCKDAEVYLCSPAVAAASAITGRITDPREL